jgi:hypothetical protein
MADQKPKIQTRTETFQVYGEAIDVTYNFIEDPEKGELLQLDKVGGRIKLNPSQEVLANKLFLHEYIETRYKTDPKEADKWLDGILQEIIIDKCRTNRDVIAAKPCTNFQAYILQLAARITRDPTKIPYIPESRIGSALEIKRQINAKAKAAAAATGISGEEIYGALTITLTIKLDHILHPEDGSDTESDTGSDIGSDSDNLENCEKDAKYEPIIKGDILTQFGGDPMEALYRIFKQYRGKTCESGNLLAKSLPYDENIKKMLNQGHHQFRQYRRIYKLYKMMP